MTIARTEKGRVRAESKLAAMHRAKDEGADIVKQWDSTMDSRTRDDHRKLNGQIRELDEDFEIRGVHGPAPHKMGRPEHDINCRCVLLQRSRTALELEGKLDNSKWDGASNCYADLSDAESYAEFKGRYDELLMGTAGTHDPWPKHGKMIRRKDYLSLREKADSAGVTLEGFRNSDVDVNAVGALLNACARLREVSPAISKAIGDTFTLCRSGMLLGEFAMIHPKYPGKIHFNAEALRNMEALKRQYAKDVAEGIYVPGTSFEAIIYHEIGHLVMMKTGITPEEVLQEAFGSSGAKVRLMAKESLSPYAVKYDDLRELASEAFSAYYSGLDNEFAEKFVHALERMLK